MPRTRDMWIAKVTVENMTSLMTAAGSAPILETIHFINTPGVNLQIIPLKLIECPLLKRIHIRCFLSPFDWVGIRPFAPNLVALELAIAIRCFSIEAPEMLRALNGMHKLETLNLSLIVPKFPADLDADVIATLPTLRYVEVLADFHTCLILLPRLVFDRTCARVKVTASEIGFALDDDAMQNALRRLVALGASNDLTFDGTTADVVHAIFSQLSASFSIATYDKVSTDCSLELSRRTQALPCFELVYSTVSTRAGQVVTHFAEAFPMSSVTSIYIGTCAFVPNTLRDLFFHVNSVKTLEVVDVSREDSRAVFATLEPSDQQLPAPQLQKIIIKGFGSDGCPSLEALRECMVHRRELECRIANVICGRDCDAVVNEAESVRELGVQVDWLPYLD
ncbi:hypothetical protein CONPUDRAFT_147547 [Coniophora puteana RWD-64-598 SS2]|uniref:F-box domain-containing protein n=1 Tax=Coniophora puteana (strain RWD-64-598) TaxID=741705 RepID=A0A5M3M886_CONPW|nr:uncharacterized protein CONPUDRAFT_147547 [Coniophora puteana RWD-64-598 SS2]EIW75010.1 hypothetical protein CONPUDRAFT_147547 [Coniophora puteana RWD-64-598 SS2]